MHFRTAMHFARKFNETHRKGSIRFNFKISGVAKRIPIIRVAKIEFSIKMSSSCSYVKPYESIDDTENFIDRAGCKVVFELCKLIPEQTANKNICFSTTPH
jgi:hypothetical protein